LAGSIFYIIHHITVKTALFLVSGITERATGTQQLHEMGGLLNTYPMVATLFILAGLSLAGMPPLSGFFAKLALLTAGVQEARYFYVGVALLGSLLTLVSMSKIYIYVFWGEEKPKRARAVRHADLLLPTAFLVLALSWAALQGELDAANLAIGFLVSAALIYLFRPMFFGPLYFRKVAVGLTLTLVFI
jgi:multicomponent Na+:H+ antiporter subunit D